MEDTRKVEIAGGNGESVVDAMDTTESVHFIEVVGSGEPDPPAC